MLVSLRLTNFAVMEEVEVAFGPGLTVLTGETGAGKSILIDALSLLAGGRAEADVVRAGADETTLEGVFERSEVLGQRLQEAGLPDEGDEVSSRRTVGRNGRGKVHVNGALATVGVLARLMKGLVDIAGQHEHMALFDASRHLSLVDRFGEVEQGPLVPYRATWALLREAESRLQALGGDDSQVHTRAEFLTFQLEEIDRVKPGPGEDALLEVERRRLASTEKLRQSAASCEELVSTRDGAALELASRALQLVTEAEKVDPTLSPVRQSLAAAQAELDDAARGLSRYLSSLESDPARLSEVDDRLDALRRLCRKHAAPLEGVIAKRESLAAELAELQQRGKRRAEVDAELVTLRASAAKLALEVTGARVEAAERLTEAVQQGFSRLAMAKARFEVEMHPVALGAEGADAVQLLFSANLGEPPRPLVKVASGGEASRVMLAIKSVLAGSDGCVCSVFDEADAGVGGAVADAVGRLIKEVSSHRQVLCITHLPQVAAHADVHLRIEKGEVRGRTRSVVKNLDAGEPRTREVARMLSGVEVTREALGAAEALLRSAARTVKAARGRKRNQPPARERRLG